MGSIVGSDIGGRVLFIGGHVHHFQYCEGVVENGHPTWEATVGKAWYPIQPQMRLMLAILKTPRMANPKALKMHGDIRKSMQMLHSCKHLDGSLYDELVRATSGNHSKKTHHWAFLHGTR